LCASLRKRSRGEMRILVVEDDSQMAELLQRGLVNQGHVVDVALDGITGLEKALAMPFDAIVLDVMLPGANGLQVAKRLRASGNRTPILMLTARDAVPDVVRGLDVGADDYLTKPFSFEVLAARLRVIGRRKTMESSPVLQISDLTLDREAHEVRRGKRAVTLSPTEFAMLEHLMRRAGRVVSRHDLIAAVWGDDHEVGSNTVDVFIFLLRSKIETGGEKRLIQTVRGLGYTVRETEA
jgi:two-component system, OmpR family, response regulator MprA